MLLRLKRPMMLRLPSKNWQANYGGLTPPFFLRRHYGKNRQAVHG
jgi:hypothetical protein